MDLKSDSNSITSSKNAASKHVKIDTTSRGGDKSASKRSISLMEKLNPLNQKKKDSIAAYSDSSKSTEMLLHQLNAKLEKEKPFKQPTKREMRRMINEYERKSRIDARKVLRWPIECWVSCGEAFKEPSAIIKSETQKIIQRENIDKAEHELEKQAHLLRQMTGRRLSKMSVGKYKSVKNPEYPVKKEGHWTEVTYEEQVKKVEVSQLKNFVDEMKYPNKSPSSTGQPLRAAGSKAQTTQLYGTYTINVS